MYLVHSKAQSCSASVNNLKNFSTWLQYTYSMHNTVIAITTAVDAEHPWFFDTQLLSTCTYCTGKLRAVKHSEIIKKISSTYLQHTYSMHNTVIAITTAVDAEHPWFFDTQLLSTCTYCTGKLRAFQHREIILKIFLPGSNTHTVRTTP